eukprot:g6979.t1
MACEGRILRVLRTLEYPGLEEAPGSGPEPALGLVARPHDLAKIVAWIEDRKVRGLAIPDRTPLRHPGPNWDAAFFSYLQEMGCPYQFTSGEQGAREGAEARDSLVLRGLSWLVTEAVACDFEDNGKEYMASARKLLPKVPPPLRTAGDGLSKPTHAAGDVAMDDGSGRNGSLRELEGFSAGVDTGDPTCDSVATVLRMLFLSDLRDLQDEVNGIIALAQSSRTDQT